MKRAKVHAFFCMCMHVNIIKYITENAESRIIKWRQKLKVAPDTNKGYMMKKRLLLGMFCTLIASLGYAQSEYKVTANSLNVRSEASTNASKLGGLTKGQTVLVFSIDGDWAIIDYKDQFGYVSKQYIEPVQPIQPVVETSDTPSLDTEFADVNSTPSMETEFADAGTLANSNSQLSDDILLSFVGLGIGYAYGFNSEDGKIQDDGAHGLPLAMYINWMFTPAVGIWADLGYFYLNRTKETNNVRTRIQMHHFILDAHVSSGFSITPDCGMIFHGGPGLLLRGTTSVEQKIDGSWEHIESEEDIWDDNIPKADFMIGLGVAVKYKHIVGSFGFNWGCVNQNKNIKGTDKVNLQRNLNVSLIVSLY